TGPVSPLGGRSVTCRGWKPPVRTRPKEWPDSSGTYGAFSCMLPPQPPQNWAEVVVLQESLMRLEPLHRIRFTYPESWAVGLDGGWQQLFFVAEGRCEGSITGRFRGVNFPREGGAGRPLRARPPGGDGGGRGTPDRGGAAGIGPPLPPGAPSARRANLPPARPRPFPAADRRRLRLCGESPSARRSGPGR